MLVIASQLHQLCAISVISIGQICKILFCQMQLLVVNVSQFSPIKVSFNTNTNLLPRTHTVLALLFSYAGSPVIVKAVEFGQHQPHTYLRTKTQFPCLWSYCCLLTNLLMKILNKLSFISRDVLCLVSWALYNDFIASLEAMKSCIRKLGLRLCQYCLKWVLHFCLKLPVIHLYPLLPKL